MEKIIIKEGNKPKMSENHKEKKSINLIQIARKGDEDGSAINNKA